MIGAYAAVMTKMVKMYYEIRQGARGPIAKDRTKEGDEFIWDVCGEANSCIKTITRKMTPQLRLYLRETRISWVRK